MESPFLGLVPKGSRPVAKEKLWWERWAMVPLEGLQHPEASGALCWVTTRRNWGGLEVISGGAFPKGTH